MTKRVALYCRVSSASQRERDLSIPEQKRQLRDFCADKGWTVVDVFEDAAKSGAETANRPGLQAMLKAACSVARPYDLILTRDQSRLGRSDEDAVNRAKLREHGVAVDNIQSPTGDMYESLSPMGRAMERVQSAFDIQERETKRLLMIDGQKAKARLGQVQGGQATCYGYKQTWVAENTGKPTQRVPVIDKQKARVVREMFRRFNKGESLKGIARWLNASQIPAPRGKQWYDSTVRKLLSNETLLGRICYGRVKKAKHPVTRAPMNTYRPDEQVIRVDNAFPAIIDQATFDKAQAILAKNESTRPAGGHPGNTLRGVGKCRICGWHLAHQKKSDNGRWYYMCGNVKVHKVKNSNPLCKGILYADYVDEVVELFLQRLLDTSVTDLRKQVAAYNAAATDLVGLSATQALDIAISEQEQKVTNLADAVEKRGSSNTLLDRLEAAELELERLKRKRTEIAAAVQVPTVEPDAILDAHSQIASVLRKGDTERMRDILAAVCSEVTLDWAQRSNPRVAFNYFYQDARPPMRANGKASRIRVPANLKNRNVNADDLPDFDADAPGTYRVSITVAGAPLTFVPKWSITAAEKATEDAVARIAAALNN